MIASTGRLSVLRSLRDEPDTTNLYVSYDHVRELGDGTIPTVIRAIAGPLDTQTLAEVRANQLDWMPDLTLRGWALDQAWTVVEVLTAGHLHRSTQISHADQQSPWKRQTR